MREWLEQRATALGIEFSAETTDEELQSLVSQGIDSIVVPLASATADAEKQRQFAEMFPEQAALLSELATRDRETSSHMFAEQFARFDGGNSGYAPVVREKIEDMHQKLALRSATEDDLKSLLDAVRVKESVVDYGENGSGRTSESDAVAPTRNFVEDRKAFATLVRNAMTEDGMTRDAAIKHVSEANPELAQAYLTGHVVSPA